MRSAKSFKLGLAAIALVSIAVPLAAQPAEKPSASSRQEAGHSMDEGVAAYDSGNIKLARIIFERLAQRGQAEAQFKLAGMYEAGNGVPQDYALAVRWFKSAANQGSSYAQWALGYIYYEGQGVLRDNVEAYKWLTLHPANQADEGLRAKIAAKMTPAQIVEAERLANEWQKRR